MILGINRIMKIYCNAYDYAIHILKIIMKSIMRINVSLDISLFAHFKYKGKYIISARIPKYMHNQNAYVSPLFFMRTFFMNIKALKILIFLLEMF